MTELLGQAIAKLKTLPDDQQNSISPLALIQLASGQTSKLADCSRSNCLGTSH